MALPEVKRIAEKVIANVRSIGFALTSCTVPAKGTPTFSLGDDEIEFGVGIHGEPGVARKQLERSEALAKDMLDVILADMPVSPGERVALLINGLGGTPLQELYVLGGDIFRYLDERGIRVHRTFAGNYMTAIDMAGASVSLLKLDDETALFLDSPADTPAFKVF